MLYNVSQEHVTQLIHFDIFNQCLNLSPSLKSSNFQTQNNNNNNDDDDDDDDTHYTRV